MKTSSRGVETRNSLRNKDFSKRPVVQVTTLISRNRQSSAYRNAEQNLFSRNWTKPLRWRPLLTKFIIAAEAALNPRKTKNCLLTHEFYALRSSSGEPGIFSRRSGRSGGDGGGGGNKA